MYGLVAETEARFPDGVTVRVTFPRDVHHSIRREDLVEVDVLKGVARLYRPEPFTPDVWDVGSPHPTTEKIEIKFE